jgi:putative transposase
VAKTKPSSERPSVVAIEDLSVYGMKKNHNLALDISDAGFAEFRRQLEYKTAWAGEELLVADRFFPSSKLCHHCGCINDDLTLSDRIWRCDCGAVLDRDLNAAINLRNLAVRRVPPELACKGQANAYGEETRGHTRYLIAILSYVRKELLKSTCDLSLRLQALASAPRGSRNQTSSAIGRFE